jgi:hypothetical protein
MSKILIFEVGVGNIFLSRSVNDWTSKDNPNWDLITDIVLIEPNPILYNEIVKKTKSYKNIKVYNFAIDDTEGLKSFVLAGDRSYLAGKQSPIQKIFHNKYEDLMKGFKTFVYANTFDSIDPGNIDVLHMSIEGNEWALLEKMVSRPKIITMPHYFANDYEYILPNSHKIQEWMSNNSYFLVEANSNKFALVFRKLKK